MIEEIFKDESEGWIKALEFGQEFIFFNFVIEENLVVQTKSIVQTERVCLYSQTLSIIAAFSFGLFLRFL